MYDVGGGASRKFGRSRVLHRAQIADLGDDYGNVIGPAAQVGEVDKRLRRFGRIRQLNRQPIIVFNLPLRPSLQSRNVSPDASGNGPSRSMRTLGSCPSERVM
jgi:hypothetical protein